MQISNKSFISGSRKSRQAVSSFWPALVINTHTYTHTHCIYTYIVIYIETVCIYLPNAKCRLRRQTTVCRPPMLIQSPHCGRLLSLWGCLSMCMCVYCHCCALWSMPHFFFLGIIQQLAAMRGATLIRISRGQRVHRTWRWVFKIKLRRWNSICLPGRGVGRGGTWIVEGAENNRFKNVARKVFGHNGKIRCYFVC